MKGKYEIWKNVYVAGLMSICEAKNSRKLNELANFTSIFSHDGMILSKGGMLRNLTKKSIICQIKRENLVSSFLFSFFFKYKEDKLFGLE